MKRTRTQILLTNRELRALNAQLLEALEHDEKEIHEHAPHGSRHGERCEKHRALIEKERKATPRRSPPVTLRHLTGIFL